MVPCVKEYLGTTVELDSVLSKETLELCQTRHEEGYDLDTDTVYNV